MTKPAAPAKAKRLPPALTPEELAADPDRRLWPPQVAAILGLADTDSLRAVAGRSRRLARENRLTESDLPVPDGRDKRPVETASGVTRTVWQSWWYARTIAAYLPRRRARGNPDWIARAGQSPAA